MTRTPPHPRRRAFTLVELVTSLAVMAVLMLAIGSTVLLATKAVPHADQPMMRSVAATRALEQIASELETAIEIMSLDARDLRFTVADRDGDGKLEELRYRWSGNAGDPLVLWLNGKGGYSVVEQVYNLGVSTTTAAVSNESEVPLIEGPEETILANDFITTSYGSSVALNPGMRIAEAFRPSLGSAVKWRPTRAAVYVDPVNPKNAYFRVVLRAATGGGGPDEIELASASIAEADLPSSSWYLVALTSAFDLNTNERYYIGVEHASGTTAGNVRRGSLGLLGHYIDSGSGWSHYSLAAVWVYVWGKPLIPDPDFEGSTLTVVQRVTLSLQLGDAKQTPARTAVSLLNQPEAP